MDSTEIKQLLSAVDRSNQLEKETMLCFFFAILLGMRAGDICNLKIQKTWIGAKS